jgi:hypothetical protein
MSSLSDIIAAAKAQIKTSTSESKSTLSNTFSIGTNDIKGEVKSFVPNLIQGATRQVTGGINQALNAGLTDVRGGVSDILHGNFNGGLERILSGPSDVLGSLGKTFGLSTGSKLSNPGGVAPGNSLEGILARSDPQLSFNWYCQLPVVTAIGGQPKGLPWFFVEEATLAFRTFTPVSRFYQGRQQHIPGSYTVDALSLAIYADTANLALDYLTSWQGAIMKNMKRTDADKSGGGFGRPKDYYKTIPIYLLSNDKKTLCVIEYTECWPETIQAYSLNSGSSERIVNHVTFSTGDVFVTLFGVSNTSSKGMLPFVQDAASSLVNFAASSVLGAARSLFG